MHSGAAAMPHPHPRVIGWRRPALPKLGPVRQGYVSHLVVHSPSTFCANVRHGDKHSSLEEVNQSPALRMQMVLPEADCCAVSAIAGMCKVRTSARLTNSPIRSEVEAATPILLSFSPVQQRQELGSTLCWYAERQ